MNENQKISQLLVLFGLLILAIIFVLMSFQKNTENIKKSRFTICEIVPKDEGDTRVWFDAKFEYFVAGVKFTFLKNPKKNQFNVIGEKFVLEYDENDPDKHRIISYKPLFLEEEKTNFTTGRVLRVVRFRLNKNISTHAVYFEYTVNNISSIAS